MIIKLLVVGKNKKKWLLEGEKEFLKPLKKFAKVEVIELVQESKGDKEKIKKIEGEKIISRVGSGEVMVLMTSVGKKINSKELALELQKWERMGGGKINFVIGGSFGVSQEVVDRANYKLSFSDMTMLHEMVRVFLLEQIFRAFSINQGSQYHKGV